MASSVTRKFLPLLLGAALSAALLTGCGDSGYEPLAAGSSAGEASADAGTEVDVENRPALAKFTGGIMNLDLEKENPNCWNTRNNHGWTRTACNEFRSIGLWAGKLAAGEKHFSGQKAIKLTYIKNEEQGGGEIEVESDHIFTRFYDYYEKGFDFAQGQKIHRIRSHNTALQANNFDIILYTHSKPTASGQCGNNPMQAINIQKNAGAWWDGENISFEPGNWYRVETEIKLNTPGKKDGIARVWVDDKLMLERKDLDIRGNSTAKMNRVLFGGWYSNGAKNNPCKDPSSTSIRYIDNVAISSSRIGA